MLDGCIYVAGCSLEKGGHILQTVFERFDPIANVWEAMTPMNPRTSFGCAVLGGKLYVVGGYSMMTRMQLSSQGFFEEGGGCVHLSGARCRKYQHRSMKSGSPEIRFSEV